jgi:hypothetical protein
MSETPGDARQEEAAAAPPAASNPPARSVHPVAAGLAAIVAALIVAIITAPFWAPAVVPLLPWGAHALVSPGEHAALAARIGEIEKRPVPPPVDVGAIKLAESALAQRIDRLEAGAAAAAAVKTGLEQQEGRLAAVEAQSAGQAAAIGKLQQELSRLGGASTGLGDRLAAVERQVGELKNADRGGAALMLALLQMREAVEAARPFPAEYDAFTALAKGDPDLAAAGAPLADAARAGVAGRIVLKDRLAALGPRIAAAAEPAPDGDWWDQALARLRGLVTIRRLGGAESGPEAAVSAAEQALDRGDLAGAIAKLDALDGAARAAAEPWLRIARDRLAVETALADLQQKLTARLGGAPAAMPDKPGSPG